ncbi:hypothetical protein CIHG_09845 [Coccidioides immitis H538.4]|uniref:Uncharacterized protein n=1 Tax=Coccidioides immitis H538.4 TaxID=396776 RepID=A0A0J8S4F3_COCIT|nr:hypothetical protein CIHG_09845 [Coccidioides immitis H538.4]
MTARQQPCQVTSSDDDTTDMSFCMETRSHSRSKTELTDQDVDSSLVQSRYNSINLNLLQDHYKNPSDDMDEDLSDVASDYGIKAWRQSQME